MLYSSEKVLGASKDPNMGSNVLHTINHQIMIYKFKFILTVIQFLTETSDLAVLEL